MSEDLRQKAFYGDLGVAGLCDFRPAKLHRNRVGLAGQVSGLIDRGGELCLRNRHGSIRPDVLPHAGLDDLDAVGLHGCHRVRLWQGRILDLE